jgi:uncharacterized protein (DUF111 family)
MTELIFRHTSTIGVRETEARRWIQERRVETPPTAYGDVRVKFSSGYGVSRPKIE